MDSLSNMFSTLNRDQIDDVLRMNQGRVEAAVDQLLAMTTATEPSPNRLIPLYPLKSNSFIVFQ